MKTIISTPTPTPTSAPAPAPALARVGGPWLLLLLAVVLGVNGWLLVAPAATAPSAPSRRMPVPAPPAAPATSRPAEAPDHPAARPSGSLSKSATVSATTPGPTGELPPHGEGVAGDRAIQQLLERSWPPDLPAGQAVALTAAGRKVLLADVTGLGRAVFPAAFPPNERPATVAPAFTRIRIQAAIARKDSEPGQAVVHLVWAAADRGGTYTDGRLSDIAFRHDPGDGTWTPLHPTTP
ncbi:hypothetical protein OKJ48_02665 [Streptomyces kunmingensis]|uniref:Uncharacterized protein n=1 Tax=Streptomyces kunmingensis TaxID=68225 RepID=A0ABU6C3Q6_9ACTN|nr:hypothetical protein [Streptomyces kunmingensis]MEB3959164.1 hypothetical protein [Streptomyces kunmingensis]